jgi:AcrR family transcriptional regulator
VAVRLSHLTRELQSRIREFFDEPLGTDATPLEIREAVLDHVEARVQPVGRGKRVFPYNRVLVRIAGTRADRPALEAAFDGLDAKIRDRLAELRCEGPRHLQATTAFPEEIPATWTAGQLFAVEYGREEEPASRDAILPARQPSLRVLVLKGSAAQDEYTFTQASVPIGRTPEPADHLGRVRRNRIAFLDSVDGVTETVGRAHARLEFDAETGSYRLFDEGSSNGTSIVREGNVVPVPPQDPRGVRVESGDEIQLGRAVIQVSFETAGSDLTSSE